MKRLILLGASGSIGQSTLTIIENSRNDFVLVGFSVGKQSNKIPVIINNHPSVKHIYLIDEVEAKEFAERFPHITFYSGETGLETLVRTVDADVVINALVGFVGLVPTVAALESKKDVALANKESLVVGGELINELLKTTGQKLYPIDSEHVALAKCLAGQKRENVKRLVLTASGGSFRHLTREQLAGVSVKDALKHPSWSMGAKITIDSATMMNKGFEIIEAHYLFNYPSEQIDILMHDQSVVHSLVEFKDGSFLADLGPADMKVPIAYALYEGKREQSLIHESLDLNTLSSLTFHPFDADRYPAVAFARDALKYKGSYGTILNAANEVAVYAFLDGRLPFNQIEKIIGQIIGKHGIIEKPTLDELVALDKEIRHETTLLIESLK